MEAIICPEGKEKPFSSISHKTFGRGLEKNTFNTTFKSDSKIIKHTKNFQLLFFLKIKNVTNTKNNK